MSDTQIFNHSGISGLIQISQENWGAQNWTGHPRYGGGFIIVLRGFSIAYHTIFDSFHGIFSFISAILKRICLYIFCYHNLLTKFSSYSLNILVYKKAKIRENIGIFVLSFCFQCWKLGKTNRYLKHLRKSNLLRIHNRASGMSNILPSGIDKLM